MTYNSARLTQTLAAFFVLNSNPAHRLPDFLCGAITRQRFANVFRRWRDTPMKSSFFPVSAAGFFYYIENPAQSYVSAAEFCPFSQDAALFCVRGKRIPGK